MAKATKTYNKKQDFIALISMMSDTELNQWLKEHGKKPKPVMMYRIIDKDRDIKNE